MAIDLLDPKLTFRPLTDEDEEDDATIDDDADKEEGDDTEDEEEGDESSIDAPVSDTGDDE